MNKYPPRPTATRETILQVASDVALSLGESADGAEDIADAYMGYGPCGFRIAKELDRDGWHLTSEFVNTLDGMCLDVSLAVAELEKAWAEENGIQPPLEIGTEIKEGVIAGIYEHQPAYYLVKEHGCTNDSRHLLIKFEDAQEVTVEMADLYSAETGK